MYRNYFLWTLEYLCLQKKYKIKWSGENFTTLLKCIQKIKFSILSCGVSNLVEKKDMY